MKTNEDKGKRERENLIANNKGETTKRERRKN
jgi:hypothetical protein